MKTTRLVQDSLLAVLSFFFFSQFIACNTSPASGDEWKAPADARNITNPLENHPLTLQEGKELYNLYCAACHGEVGFGNGAARGPLGKKPANFHSEKVKMQTDGELFWKLTNGKQDMPAFEKILKEDQRWELVTYLRNIPDRAPMKTPVALRPDIKVEHFMTVDSLAVRLLQHPLTGELWYTTFNGNVFRIKDEKDGSISYSFA